MELLTPALNRNGMRSVLAAIILWTVGVFILLFLDEYGVPFIDLGYGVEFRYAMIAKLLVAPLMILTSGLIYVYGEHRLRIKPDLPPTI